VDYIAIDKCGRLSIDDLESKLRKYAGCVKLVAVTGASNVTGFINPIYTIAKLAHKYNTKILVDGAQLIPHSPLDMKAAGTDEHIDFAAFSAHKMYAPFGTGALIAPKEIFMKGEPDYPGGGTVHVVTTKYVVWNEPPHKEEAGTPNIMGVVALTAAIRTLKKIGMNKIKKYEDTLVEYALSKLKKIPDIRLYCPSEGDSDRVSIIPFNITGVHHAVTARALSYEYGISVRSGCFCAHPYLHKLLNLSDEEIMAYANDTSRIRPGLVRLSFGLYNDTSEIDRLIDALKSITANKQYYINRYSD
jgi:selenocysteine lyase/cysteine desulfurase